MLRTMELLVGLPPMTQFDAAAMPMFDAFTPHPDTPPYTVQKPSDTVLTAVNGANAPMAAAAAAQDLSREDHIDEQTFNAEVWEERQGQGLPGPRAAAPGDQGRRPGRRAEGRLLHP